MAGMLTLDEVVTTRVSGEELMRLDMLAEQQGVSRSVVVRLAILAGLNSPAYQAYWQAYYQGAREGASQLHREMESVMQRLEAQVAARIAAGG